jgi:hypothetical protein
MNDIYGMAPNAHATVAELRVLLATFGPHNSRYVWTLPSHKVWRDSVLAHFSHLGEIDQARLKSILSKAIENSAFMDRSINCWPSAVCWLKNALEYWRMEQPPCKPIYVSDVDYDDLVFSQPGDAKFLISPYELSTVSPADEEIGTRPEDYWKVSKWLCTISGEVHFIDPYFDPTTGTKVRDVFVHFLEQIALLRKLEYVHFWVRFDVGKDSFGRRRDSLDRRRVSAELRDIMKQATHGVQRGLRLSFHWVEDGASADRLHARYLLTEKGGIKFDQGFQRIHPVGKKNMVSPVGHELHLQLFRKFSRKENSFKVLETVEVRA